MKVSNHFIRSEFACKCGCGFDSADKLLVEVLEGLRSHFVNKYPKRKIAIIITSGNRCKKHNKQEGGSEKSYHVRGLAVDFRIKNVHEDEVVQFLEIAYPSKFGIGQYTNRTHLDVRNSLARWDKRGL